MSPYPSPPAWCRTFAQRGAWRAGFKAALQSVVTEQQTLPVEGLSE